MGATLLGKQILVFGEGPPISEAELRTALEGLNLRDALRFIGQAYAAIAPLSGSFGVVQDVPIPAHALPYLALLLILDCFDTGADTLDESRLVDLIRAYHNLQEAPIDDARVFEYLLRLGQSQFSFQLQDHYAIPRSLILFSDIWPLKRRGALPRDVATAATGFSIEELLLFGDYFSRESTHGFATPKLHAGEPTSRALRLFTPQRQLAFLEYFSTNYQTIRNSATAHPTPLGLEKYRFNPLAIYPLLKPDVPPPTKQPVYLIPCWKFLIDRVTHGISFDCSNKFDNAFDSQFGLVFEEYVGVLLRAHFPDAIVLGNFSYHIDGTRYLSPDWILIDHDRAVIIEVKKSLLRSRAKTYGSTDAAQRDLKGTLDHARSQLNRFVAHFPHLRNMPAPQNVELVVISWDETSWMNSFLQSELSTSTNGDRVHAMSILEFERLLARCVGCGLYDLLWAKRLSDDHERLMDIGDWLLGLGRGTELQNKFLINRHKQFLKQWGSEEDGD